MPIPVQAVKSAGVQIVFRGPGQMVNGVEVCIVKWNGKGVDVGKTYTFVVGEPTEVSAELAEWALEQNSRHCKTVAEARDYGMRIFEIVKPHTAEGGEV